MMTRRGHTFGTCWLIRLLRGLRPDRNPLRRGSDRAETLVLAALLAAFLAGAPFAAGAAGHWASLSATRQGQAQRASLTQVTAALVRKAPVWTGSSRASRYPASSRCWPSRAGWPAAPWIAAGSPGGMRTGWRTGRVGARGVKARMSGTEVPDGW